MNLTGNAPAMSSTTPQVWGGNSLFYIDLSTQRFLRANLLRRPARARLPELRLRARCLPDSQTLHPSLQDLP